MRSRFAVVLGWTGLLAAAPAVVYLVLFHGTLTAAAAVAACFTLLVWPRPDLALLVLLALVPVAAVADPTGAAAVALVTGVVALLLLRTVVLSGLRVRADLVVIVLMAFVVTASYLLPQVALTVERQWKGYVLLLVALGLLVVSAAAPADPLRIAQVVAIAGACAAGYLLLRGEYAADRLTGLGLNPNYAGAMLALPLVAAAGLARLHRSWLWLLPALVCGAAILQTRSRGTFLMVAAGLACVVLVGRPLRHKVLIALSLAGVALALPGTLDVVGENLTGSRTSTELTSNTEVRKQAAWLAARVALEHPLRGIGYGAFPDYARTSSELGIYINTHNDLLRLAVEAGIGALALFAVLLWLGLARRHAPHQAILQSMGVAYVVGLLFANTLTHVIVTAPFWVCLGCLLAQPRHTQPTTTPSPTPLLSVRKT